MRAVHDIPGITVYGPSLGVRRAPLVAFNLAGVDPMHVTESRAGCHCATLAHHDLGLTPPVSCRLSFALYTDTDDVERGNGRAAAGSRTDPAHPA